MLLLTPLLLFIVSSWNPPAETADESPETNITARTMAENTLDIYMLNTGQGDAILIRTDSQTVLMDTSDSDEREKLCRELDKLYITKIDRLILTHSHADHIGNAKYILQNYRVSEVLDNGFDSRSRIYHDTMELIQKNNISHRSLTASDVLKLGSGAVFQVLWPSQDLVDKSHLPDYKNDPNNESIVGQLILGNFRMLFTGDIESFAENQLMATCPEKLKADILKAPHHGSSSSVKKDFLRTVSPKYLIISAGEPGIKNANEYGHPHKKALRAYQKAGIPPANMYWTFRNGTIHIHVDSRGYRVLPEQKDLWAADWMKEP